MTKISGVWPLPYCGLPGLFSILSVMFFALAVYVAKVTNFGLALFAIGVLLGLLSSGKGVILDHSRLILEYGFPKALIKIVIQDVTGVSDVSAIERGCIIKYFKAPICTALVIICFPVLYVAGAGMIPSVEYIPLITLPAIIGVILVIVLAYTGTSYKAFVRKLGCAVGGSIGLLAFIVGVLYHEVYGRSIFSDPHSLAVAFMALMLLGISTAVFTTLYQKHHIVIIKANHRYYAVGASSEEKALEFIKMVLEVIKHA